MNASSNKALLEAFGQAWNSHDLAAALALTTEDCVFESTSPGPDGQRSVGSAELRAAWEPIFADTSAQFEVEELVMAGDRAFQLWTYHWADGHVRGVDIFTIRDGKIAAKLSYVKG